MARRSEGCGLRPDRRRIGVAGLVLFALSSPFAHAQDLASVAKPGPVVSAVETKASEASRSAILENERREKAEALAALAGDIELSKSTIERLDDEIAALSSDRDEIQGAMIEAAAAQKKVSRELAATERRTDDLATREGTIKASLDERRGVLAEVLGALERMGRKPPPALLVKPQDALGSVRSAILLGAVVPSIRGETEKLVADLTALADVRSRIETEKRRFAEQMTRHREEEARLSKLFAEKQKLEATSRDRREAMAQRAEELAAKATDLESLIASLATDIDSARAAEDAARRAEAKRLEAEEAAKATRLAEERREAETLERERLDRELAAMQEGEGPTDENRVATVGEGTERTDATNAEPSDAEADRIAPQGEVAVASLEPQSPTDPLLPGYDMETLRREAQRLAPGAVFSTLKGRLSKPVAGTVLVGFGEEDDIGRTATGVSFASRPQDVVTAPADASVLYAGPFRSYGQLLILDAGGGYHVVMAGMEKIDVSTGQFVVAGEPVATMGAKRVASVAVAEFGTARPTLYVEFRRDGKPVDPSPWWIDEPSGRTRNDS